MARAAAPAAVPITFVKGAGRRYRSLLRRADGVEVSFEGGSYNTVGGRAREVPHDLAHLVVEDELRLSHGVWGVLAAGGLFGLATVVGGRQAPHAARRGRELVRASEEQLRQAEVLTRAVCDVCAGALPADLAVVRRSLGPRWWSDALTADALDRCRTRLRENGERWAALRPDETLVLSWPLGRESATSTRSR